MAPQPSILVVDDDPSMGEMLVEMLGLENIPAQWVSSGVQALEIMAQRYVGLVISDVKMPELDGIELLTRIKRTWPDVQVVMISGSSTLERAVEAMKRGASDFIEKPFKKDEILFVVKKESARLASQSLKSEQAPSKDGFCPPRSAAMRAFDERLTSAAKSNATVMLRGENGVGKELAARAVHSRGKRASGPFIVFQASSLPKELLPSELFGSEKGAHSTATARKPGRVELADGGTLFLDELGDTPLEAQSLLLRLIQEKEYTPLGEGKPRQADIRFVAATNRDLEAMVVAGTFRQDLYQRLNVVPLVIPPLRERREDIRPLAQQFCQEHGAANDRPKATLTDDALALLETQPWPGNVRQLQNFVERLVVMSEGDRIDGAMVSRELGLSLAPSPISAPAAPGAAVEASLTAKRGEAERAAIVDAISRCHGNCTQAAKLLGIGRRTLYNKLDELGIDHRKR